MSANNTEARTMSEPIGEANQPVNTEEVSGSGVNRIKDFVLNNAPEGFAGDGVKFSILCEKEPIVGTYTIKAKALYIIYKKNNNVSKLYPENIVQPWFEFTETNRRRLNNKKKPFWINGDTTIQHFIGRDLTTNGVSAVVDHEYINYSLASVKKSEEAIVKAFRKKYNVVEPTIYEGEQLGLEL